MINNAENSGATMTPRQRWMQVLARAGNDLMAHSAALRQSKHRFIRPSEVGMVMVRGRIGANGAPFNLGEMTVTRCVVQLDEGSTGYSYVAGRSKPHAELAALADAHLQGDAAAHWMATLIDPIEQSQIADAARHAAQTGATKVDFVTMARGEG